MENRLIVDVHGKPVEVGTKVRVLSLPSGVIERVEPEEVERVRSMVGEVFEVDEIDEHGCAWVTKWWEVAPGETDAHGLALSPENMEAV